MVPQFLFSEEYQVRYGSKSLLRTPTINLLFSQKIQELKEFLKEETETESDEILSSWYEEAERDNDSVSSSFGSKEAEEENGLISEPIEIVISEFKSLEKLTLNFEE